jgi:hypothetical protein
VQVKKKQQYYRFAGIQLQPNFLNFVCGPCFFLCECVGVGVWLMMSHSGSCRPASSPVLGTVSNLDSC